MQQHDDHPHHASHREEAEREPFDQAEGIVPPTARDMIADIATIVGWLCTIAGAVMAAWSWLHSVSRSHPSVVRMMQDGDIRSVAEGLWYAILLSGAGLIGLVLGFVAYRASRRTMGRTLIIMAFIVFSASVLAELRPRAPVSDAPAVQGK